MIPIWRQGITGKGVVVTILDDGKSKFLRGHTLMCNGGFPNFTRLEMNLCGPNFVTP